MTSFIKRGVNSFLKIRKHENIFLKKLFSSVESAEEIIACNKRLLPLGGQAALLNGWQLLVKLINLITQSIQKNKLLTDLASKSLENLGSLSVLFSLIQLPFLAYKFLFAALFSHDKPYYRAIQFLAMCAAFTIVLLSVLTVFNVLIIAPPILLFIGGIRGTAEHVSGLFVALLKRFVRNDIQARIKTIKEEIENEIMENPLGEISNEKLDELRTLTNEQCARNNKILNKLNASFLASITLISAGFCLNPLTALPGTIILTAITSIALFDITLAAITKKNSTQWIARGINFLYQGFFSQPEPLFNLKHHDNNDALLANIRRKVIREHPEKYFKKLSTLRPHKPWPAQKKPMHQERDKGKERRRSSTALILSETDLPFDSPSSSTPSIKTTPPSQSFILPPALKVEKAANDILCLDLSSYAIVKQEP